MIFVTVGSLYPFDRLVEACDQLAAASPDQQWIAQIHEGSYEPTHMQFERYMDKASFDAAMADAEVIVSHAGMGTINGALALGKPLLVVPRRKAHGEHVNDHQVSGAEVFRAGWSRARGAQPGRCRPHARRCPLVSAHPSRRASG